MPPAAFLRPSRAEQEAIKTKKEEAERQKKAAAKVKAAERKRKRDEDAARVKELAANIVRDRPPPEEPPPWQQQQPGGDDGRCAKKVKAYLDAPPYFGRSARADCARVKELLGTQRVWDKERKLWATRLVDQLEGLVRSGKWAPFGIEPEWYPHLVLAANERAAEERARAEAVANVKWENSNNAIKAAQEAAGGTGHLNGAERAALSKKRAVNELMVDPTPEEVRACAELGFTEAAIVASRHWYDMGLGEARAGMSDEGRLLRRVAHVESDRAFDFERTPEVYWDPARLRPHLDAAVAELVAACNRRAA